MFPLVREFYHQSSFFNKRSSLILLFALIGVFSVWHVSEVFQPETYQYTTNFVNPYLENCSLLELPDLRAPLKLYTLCFSDQIFGNARIAPFLFTISLFPLTYLLTVKITKSYQAGMLATAILFGSKIIGLLGPTVAFSPDWAVTFFGSIYMIYKKPVLVGPLFLISVAMKGIGVLMLPVILYWILKADITQNSKLVSVTSLLAAFTIVITLWLLGNSQIIQPDGFSYNPDKAPYAISTLSYVFRNDMLQFVFVSLSILNLSTLAYKNQSARLLLLMSLGYYSLVLLLPIFSIYMMYDYRMIPLIIFSSIGCAMIPQNPIYDKILKHISTIPAYVSRLQFRKFILSRAFQTISASFILSIIPMLMRKFSQI